MKRFWLVLFFIAIQCCSDAQETTTIATVEQTDGKREQTKSEAKKLHH
jgi:hypothetical protein